MRPWTVSLMPCMVGRGGLWPGWVGWWVNCTEVCTTGRDADRWVQDMDWLVWPLPSQGLAIPRAGQGTVNGTSGANSLGQCFHRGLDLCCSGTAATRLAWSTMNNPRISPIHCPNWRPTSEQILSKVTGQGNVTIMPWVKYTLCHGQNFRKKRTGILGDFHALEYFFKVCCSKVNVCYF